MRKSTWGVMFNGVVSFCSYYFDFSISWYVWHIWYGRAHPFGRHRDCNRSNCSVPCRSVKEKIQENSGYRTDNVLPLSFVHVSALSSRRLAVWRTIFLLLPCFLFSWTCHCIVYPCVTLKWKKFFASKTHVRVSFESCFHDFIWTSSQLFLSLERVEENRPKKNR